MCNFIDVFPFFLHFSVERFGTYDIIFYLCTRLNKPAACGKAGQDINGAEAEKAICKDGLEKAI